MKQKDRKILIEKTKEELEKALKDAKGAIETARLEHVQGKLKNTSLLTIKRREIALIQTKLTEKRFEQKMKGKIA